MRKLFLLIGVVSMVLMTNTALASSYASNSDTGENSQNKAEIKVDNDISTDISNENKISNLFDLILNTGDNTANLNDGDGKITTGEIEFNLLVRNIIGRELGLANNIIAEDDITPIPVPITGGVGGVPTAIADESAALIGGVGGVPDELPRVGANNFALALLVGLFANLFFLQFRKKSNAI